MITKEILQRIRDEMFPMIVEPVTSKDTITSIRVYAGLPDNYVGMEISEFLIGRNLSPKSFKKIIDTTVNHIKNSLERKLMGNCTKRVIPNELTKVGQEIIVNIDMPQDKEIIIVHPTKLNNMRANGLTYGVKT